MREARIFPRNCNAESARARFTTIKDFSISRPHARATEKDTSVREQTAGPTNSEREKERGRPSLSVSRGKIVKAEYTVI